MDKKDIVRNFSFNIVTEQDEAGLKMYTRQGKTERKGRQKERSVCRNIRIAELPRENIFFI